MAAGLSALARELCDALAGFDPALLTGEDCAVLAERLAVTEKACAVARIRAAARAAECRAHESRGFSDAAEWLARASGSSVGAARSALRTAAASERCPDTREAMVRGELSLTQAEVIVDTEAECPGSEAELLALSRRSDLASLMDEGRRRRLAANDPEELHSRQRRARQWRHWRDAGGMICMTGALPPEVGVPIVNRLEATTDRIRRAARREGSEEPRAAHMADALVRLVAGPGGGKAGSADLVIVTDLKAWRRGEAEQGEVCHVIGGGPVPVSVAKELAADAFLKAVLHDGVRILTVAHLGRRIPAELRTALDLGSPPTFDGVHCVEEGCGRRYGLEWDHVDPVTNGGTTSYENLQCRCWPHHRAKTEMDRAAGLLRAGRGGRPPPPGGA